MATGQEGLKLYLPPAEAARLRELAAAEGRTVTGLLRLLVRRYLDSQEAEPAGLPQKATAGSDSGGI